MRPDCCDKTISAEDHTPVFVLAITEVLRWCVIIIPWYLSIWRYAELRGYYMFVPNATNAGTQFWGIVSVMLLGGSFLIYLPIKIVVLRQRIRKNKLKGMLWRPSIVAYLIFCSAPCIIIILFAAKTADNAAQIMDHTSIVILQVVVLGLTFTEWISKLREERLTYDLVSAMADDFFFAYDVIAFITLATNEEHLYNSAWVYVCFSFAFVSMSKYIISIPQNIRGKAGRMTAVAIFVSLFFCDIPFVIIRLWTMILYGFVASDIIYPIKNVALIIFSAIQLHIIYVNQKKPKSVEDEMDAPERIKRKTIKPLEKYPKRRMPRDKPDSSDSDASDFSDDEGNHSNPVRATAPKNVGGNPGTAMFMADNPSFTTDDGT